MANQGNRFQTIFIGNLPNEGTEDELRNFFSQVGPVSTLRVVVDRDSGQRKGFAFLEYFEPDTAQRAVRDLNGIDFYGRPLRVNIAEQDTKHALDGPTHSKKRKGGAPAGNDRVAAVIAATASAQLFDVLQQAKILAAHQPHDLLAVMRGAAAQTHQQPHLLRALHLALDRLTPAYHAPDAPVYFEPPPHPQHPVQHSAPPPHAPPPHAPPPPMHPPMQPPGALPPQQKAQQLAQSGLLDQVLSLTPEMLNALPAHERAQMIALQQELRRGQQ